MLILPLISALIYPFGSLWVKQGQAQGVGPWTVAVIGNLIIATCFMPLLILMPGMPDWHYVQWPIIAGGCFFGGQFFTVLALRCGDVSMVAPIMGCKILFVALYSSLLGVEVLGPMLWIAAGLTTFAIFLLGWSDKDEPNLKSDSSVDPKSSSTFLPASMALISCAFFAGVDTSISHAGASFGRLQMLIGAMVCFAILSLLLSPLSMREKKSAKGMKAITFGNIAYGIQALLLNITNVTLAAPTVINIIYSSRGLFGISHVWFLGGKFENYERHEVGKTVMIRRCAGAALLMVAILLVVLQP